MGLLETESIHHWISPEDRNSYFAKHCVLLGILDNSQKPEKQ
jgi:hypothetical protein